MKNLKFMPPRPNGRPHRVRTHDPAKLEEARKAVNTAFEFFTEAGQEDLRRYFEDRLREIDGQLAAQREH